MAEETKRDEKAPTGTPTPPRKRTTGPSAGETRTIAAQVIWTICALAALFLAVGALLVAIEANTDNALVKLVLDVAEDADLGVFSRDNGPVQFQEGSNADVKNALVNWGLGALAWLMIGKVLDKLIRPRDSAR